MPRYPIQQRVDAHIATEDYNKVTPKELSCLVNRIKSHWGEDHRKWLPTVAQPERPPIKWKAGIIVELSTLAPLMSDSRQRATAVAEIGRAHARRLAGEHAYRKVADSSITAKDVSEVCVKAHFIACIKMYWVGDADQWFPEGAINNSSAFDLDSKILYGMAFLAQMSSFGSHNRMEDVRALIARKIEERTGSGGLVNEEDIFATLDENRRTWLSTSQVNARFYGRLPYKRTETEKQAQIALDNAANARGSAYGTPSYGVTISTVTEARKGISLKITQGFYWRMGFRRASMVPLHTDEKTKANIKIIGELETLYQEPLAIIIKSHELGTMEALAIPTDLLQKIKTLAEQFALPLDKLHRSLSRKWQEKASQMCPAMDNNFRSLKASDIEELIQETLKASPSPPPSPTLDHLFEEPAEDSLACTPLRQERPWQTTSSSPVFEPWNESQEKDGESAFHHEGTRKADESESDEKNSPVKGRTGANEGSPGSERPRKRVRHGDSRKGATGGMQNPDTAVPALGDNSNERGLSPRVQVKEKGPGEDNGAMSRHNDSRETQPIDSILPAQHPRPEDDHDRIRRDLQSQVENERQARIVSEKRCEELEALLDRYRRRFGELE
ncbi:hypothetical protein HDK64DRAFT_249030 [Phyllosticta capitalensis]